VKIEYNPEFPRLAELAQRTEKSLAGHWEQWLSTFMQRRLQALHDVIKERMKEVIAFVSEDATIDKDTQREFTQRAMALKNGYRKPTTVELVPPQW